MLTTQAMRLVVSLASIANYYLLLLFAYLIKPFEFVVLMNTVIIPIISISLGIVTYMILHRAKVKSRVALISWISIIHLVIFLFVAYFIIDTLINPQGIWIKK